MKPINLKPPTASNMFFCSLIALLFVGCTSGKRTDVVIDVNLDNVVSEVSQGIGASFHAIEDSIIMIGDRSYGGSAWGANPAIDDDESWEKVFYHAKWLGLDWTRMEIDQRMYNPEENVYTWDSPEMKILYRYLDFCNENNVDVLLQQMWSNAKWMAYPKHRDNPIGIICSAPYDKEKFAESYATLIEYLTKTKGYHCIKWLHFSNEPGESWSWWQSAEDIEVAEDINPVYPIMRKALDKKGVKVPLIGPDRTFYMGITPDLFPVSDEIGAYDIHSYGAKFDWFISKGFDTIEEMSGDIKKWIDRARSENKPLLMTEYGTFIYGAVRSSNAVASRNAVLKDAQLIIRMMNLGVNGFNKWSFINKGSLDGQWQLIDTWDIANNKLLPADSIKPHSDSYECFALLSRFLPRGMKVVESTVIGGADSTYQRVFASVLKSDSGDITALITNDSDSTFYTSFKGTIPNKEYYIYSMENLSPQKVDIKTGFTIPPKSVLTISTYELKNSDMGKISNDTKK